MSRPDRTILGKREVPELLIKYHEKFGRKYPLKRMVREVLPGLYKAKTGLLDDVKRRIAENDPYPEE